MRGLGDWSLGGVNMAKEGEKVIESSIEKLIRWKVWTEHFSILIGIGILPIALSIIYCILWAGIYFSLELVLGLLCIILALFGVYFDIMSIISFFNEWFSPYGLFSKVPSLPIILRYLIIFGLFLSFIGIILWIFFSIRYKYSKQSFLKSVETEDAVINSLISHVQNKNYGEYGAIIAILGDIGDKRATASVILALKDGDEDVRKKAAKALGKIGDAKAVGSLDQALGDTDEDVRTAAKKALKKIKRKEKAETDNRIKSGD